MSKITSLFFPIGLILLALYIANFGRHHEIPVATFLIILGQTVIYINGLTKLNHIWNTCISAEAILKKKEYKRIFLGQLNHADDIHLFFNMTGFLWQGYKLERRYGGANFTLLLPFLLLLTGVIYVLLSLAVAHIIHEDYHKVCGVGFSGVLFALKILLAYDTDIPPIIIFNTPISYHALTWIELFLTLLFPGASFVGHAAGIFAGLIYIKTPIGYLVDFLIALVAQTPMSHGPE